jgi:SAM-dependent methyltransferase
VTVPKDMNNEGLKSKPNMGDLYDEQAESFAAQAPGLVWWETLGKPAFSRHLGEFYGKANVRVLDLGSASGRVAQHLVDNGISAKNITGIEISPKQVEIARRRIPEATFEVGDITKAILPPNQDVVTSNMVFEFLDDDGLQQALINAYKSLKPGGTLFYITTHPDKMKADTGLQEPGMFEATFPWGETGPNYYRTKEAFLGTTGKAGFKVQEVEELGIPPEAREIDPKEYERYAAYDHIRLVVRAVKPTA